MPQVYRAAQLVRTPKNPAQCQDFPGEEKSLVQQL